MAQVIGGEAGEVLQGSPDSDLILGLVKKRWFNWEP